MKNLQKGFIVPVLLAIIAVLVIGGGVYIYESKKTETPPVVNNQNQLPTQNQQQTNTQIPPVNTQTNTPPPQISENKKGVIISFVVNPCSQNQYSCVYSYGAKAVLLGKNLTSATMKSSGNSGSGAVPFDDVIGKMIKVSESVNGDRWESVVRTGLEGTASFYVETKDSQGNILKSEKLHLQYESASNLTITSPQRSEELQRGSTKEIKWTISNPPKNSWVRIDISKVPESGQTLSLQEAIVLQKDVPSNSSFTWNIPSNLEARRYEMRVDLYGEASNFDTWIVRSITDFVVK